MKTIHEVFGDIRNGKQREIGYPALICLMAEGNCAECQFAKEYQTPEFGCVDWLLKKLRERQRVPIPTGLRG